MLALTPHMLNTNTHINYFSLPNQGINVSLRVVTEEKIRLSL